MLKPILKAGNRTLVVTLECVAVGALVAALAFGAFVWRVSQGPMSIGFAKEYLEEALSRQQEGLRVRFDDIVFSWPALEGPFQLDMTGVKITHGADEENALNVASASVGLSRRALLFGLVRPVSVIVREPALEFVRDENGRLSLFLNRQGEQKPEAAPPQAPQEASAPLSEDISKIFKDMANNERGSFIARLREFRIEDASVRVRDLETDQAWTLSDMDFSLQEHEQGVSASFIALLPGEESTGASVAMDMVYRTKSDDFRGAAHIEDLNPAIMARFIPLPGDLAAQDLTLDIDLELAMNAAFFPTFMNLTAGIGEGQIVLPSEYDAPIPLRNLVLEADYNQPENTLGITKLSGSIGGIAFEGNARANFSQGGMTMPVSLSIPSADIGQIAALFPKSEHDGDAYEWLGRNIAGGTVTDAILQLEVTAFKNDPYEIIGPADMFMLGDWNEAIFEATESPAYALDVPQLQAGFAFEGATVTYVDTLRPAKEARGKAKLDLADETLEITEASGKAGDLGVQNLNVKVTELMTVGGGYVTVSGDVAGPLSSALSYIADAPIDITKDITGIDPASVKGVIEAKVEVGLPTIDDVPKEDVNVSVNGTATGVDIPNIVEGLGVTGGPLKIATEPGGFRITGDASLAGRATSVDYHQYFESEGNPYSTKVVARIGADQELRNHFGVDLDDYISGTVPVDIVYTEKGGDANLDIKADLTPVQIAIEPFRYEKAPGAPGTASAQAVLKNDVLKEVRNISLSAPDFTAANARLSFAPMNGKKADLSSGNVPNVTIGKTQMAVTFNVDSANVMNVKASGPVFDLAPFLAQKDKAAEETGAGEKQQPMKISLNADTMTGENGGAAKAAKAYLELDDDGDFTRIEYDATIGGGGFFARFKPDGAGMRDFRLEAADAGAFLNTFGLYPDIEGGTLIIYGAPKKENAQGDLSGTMRMENFRVVRAPVLARLLGLMSLTGLTQLLSNEGLAFAKLESGFEWRFRPDGNLLLIKDGTTSGSSVGLTFSGTVNMGRDTMDVAGTIIPMTEVNSLISKIPVVGDLLGGAGGLIAATYSMKGATSEPSVTVNPLSVLAPGIIRRILFEGGFASKIPGDPESAPAPSQPQAQAR